MPNSDQSLSNLEYFSYNISDMINDFLKIWISDLLIVPSDWLKMSFWE